MTDGAFTTTGWSIRARLLAAFAVVGVLVVGSAVAGLVVTGASTTTVRDVAADGRSLQQVNSLLREAATATAADLRGYLISGDDALRQEVARSWADYQGAAALSRTRCASQPGACALADQQIVAMQRWYDAYAGPVLTGTRTRSEASRLYPESSAALATSLTLNDEVTRTVDRGVDDALRRADRRRWVGLLLLIGSTVLAAVCLVVLAWLTVREVVHPLTSLRNVLRRLTAGDLEARVEVRGPIEMRGVATSVNRLAEQSLRLRDAEFARAQIRGLTRDLDRRMRQHLHADAVADEVVTGLGPMVRADRVHVRFIDGGRMGPVAAQWSTPALPEVAPEPPAPTDPLESAGSVAARGHQSLVVDDIAVHLSSVAPENVTTVVNGYADVGPVVVAPVLVGLERVGVLVCARSRERGRFDAAETGLVETVAGDLARAVQHARLFEQQSSLVGQLRELDRTKSDFLSTISHELRTPLTSIAGYVEMMRDGDAGALEPLQDNMLEIVGRNTQRLRDLIEDVLMMSRVESGAVRSERAPVALAGIVDHVAASLRPQADAAGVAIDTYPVPDGAMLLGDAAQIDRMLLNLVGNAVKFTPRRGRATVSVEVTGADLVVRVEDTGIGIPADEVASLFTRFYRASNATQRQIPGTGLGLAIIAGIVASHDGRVEVDSREGSGTTFTVTLPRWDPGAVPGQAGGLLRV